MLISFIYRNNTFNFEVKEDLSLSYLKNLASKMIKRDKSSFDLIYNDIILSEKNITLIQTDKKESDIKITISLKKSSINSNRNILEKKEIKLPLLTLSNTNKNLSENNDNNNLDFNEISYINTTSRDSNQDIIKNKRIISKRKFGENKICYTSTNKVFEDIFNAKEENINKLTKELNNKILEYDDFLYKNKNYEDKSQLLLFEKNILNYQDKQIEYLKKLLNHFDNKDSSFFSVSKINLEDFYIDLFNYNNNNYKNYIFKPYSNTKNKKIANKNNIKIKLTNWNDEKVYKLSTTKQSEDNIITPKKELEEPKINNETIKGKKEKLIVNNKTKQEQITPMKITKSFEKSKDENFNSEEISSPPEIIQKDKKDNENDFLKYNNSKKETSKNKSTNKIMKAIENQNIKEIQSTKSLNFKHRNLKESFNQKKIATLFDISENKNEEEEESESEEGEVSDNILHAKKKNRTRIERNFKVITKTFRDFKGGDSHIGYKIKTKERRTTQRIKKLGKTLSDFII